MGKYLSVMGFTRAEKNVNWNGGGVIRYCEHCGKEFRVKSSALKRKRGTFCSKECYNNWIRETGVMATENNPSWKGGVSFEPYSPEFNGKLKERVRMRDGGRCVFCGLTDPEHVALFGYPLHVHHTDGDKKNSSPSNLLTLCQYCHNRWHGRFGF